MEQQKAAKKQLRHQQSEADRKEQYERDRIYAVQNSPGAKASAHMMKEGLTKVYDKAFKHFGIDLNIEDMVATMGLNKIIENQKLGLPWDEGSASREAAISTAREQRENTRRYMENKNAFDQGASYGLDEMIATAQITPDEDPWSDIFRWTERGVRPPIH